MQALTSAQRKFLRGRAHHLDPVVFVGKQGVTGAVLASVDEALTANELIKIRFVEFKQQRKELTAEIAADARAGIAGIIGHVAILYRQHPDEEKRRITLP